MGKDEYKNWMLTGYIEDKVVTVIKNHNELSEQIKEKRWIINYRKLIEAA